MSDTLTLAEFRNRVRQRADMENSTFVSDAELNAYINESYKELYDLLVDSGENYFISSVSFSITSGNTYTLPADFYKMTGLDDLTDPVRPSTVNNIPFSERNSYQETAIELLPEFGSNVRYRLMGNTLMLLPAERAQKSYKLWYVPIPTAMTIDANTADGIQGWNEYVVIDAAIKCKIKEETSTVELERSKAAMSSRIQSSKRDRDQGMPEKVSRIRTNQYRYGVFSYPTGG